jgi:hypothetical protein
MFLVTLSNCAIVIASLFMNDPEVLLVFETMDKVYLSIYVVEFILKVIAMGFEDYFEDDWYPQHPDIIGTSLISSSSSSK